MTMTDSSMAKDTDLVVSRVANGYLVHQRTARGDYHAVDESMVFPSFAALVEHLGKHFTHRCAGVPMDQPEPTGFPLVSEG